MDNTAPGSPPKKRILIIEDEKYLRELYAEILEEEGYSVEQAADGEEGLQALVKGGFDLVLLDIVLPKIDGMTILKRLKTDTLPQKPNGPVIVLSNLGQDTIVADAVDLGVRGYMVKSDYTPDQIVKEVKEYLTDNSN